MPTNIELLGDIDVGEKYLIQKALSTFPRYMESFRQLEMQKFQYDIDAALRNEQFVALVLPREHGKSEFVAESFVNYYLMKEPDRYANIFSATSKQAGERLTNIQMQISKPYLRDGTKNYMRHYMPDQKTIWSSRSMIYRNGSKAAIGGSSGESRGTRFGDERPGLIETDDPVHEQPGKDDHVNRWFFETVLSLGNEWSQYLLTGTPRRNGDLIMTIIDQQEEKGFCVIHLPCHRTPLNSIEDLLWPDKWLAERKCCQSPDSECYIYNDPFKRAVVHVNQKKRRLGSLAWSRDWMVTPIPDGAATFPKLVIENALDTSRVLTKPLLSYSTRVNGVDPAASEDVKESGNTAIVTLEFYTKYECVLCNTTGFSWKELPCHKEHKKLFTTKRNITPLDIEYFSGDPYGNKYFEYQIKRIELQHQIYDTEICGIENNSYQAFYEAILIENDYTFPALGLYTGSDKHDLQLGVPALRGPLEVGQFRLPWGDPKIHTEEQIAYTRKQVGFFIKELSGYYMEKGKIRYSGVAHGDTVMATWKAWQAIKELDIGSYGELGDYNVKPKPKSLYDNFNIKRY